MSRRTNFIVGAAAVAMIAGGAATAFAQAQSDPPRRVEREVRIQRDGDRVVRIERDGDDVRIERDGRRMMIHRGPGHRDQAEYLKNILQLRPNQEPALTAYLEAMKPKMRTERIDARDDRPDTTTEKLARMEQRLAERQAAERSRIEAVRRFYAQLDARQKKAFDELPLMMGGPGMMPMRAMRIRHDLRDVERLHFPPERFEAPLPPAPPAPPAPPSL